MCTDLTWEGTAPRRPAQRTAEAPLRCGHCAWSRLPLLAFLSSLQGRDETRRDIIPSLSPHLSTRPRSPSLLRSAPAAPLPCRDLPHPPLDFSLLLHPASDRVQHPRSAGSADPGPESPKSPIGPDRSASIPPDSSTAGEAVRLNRPIGREFGRSGCERSGGPRI